MRLSFIRVSIRFFYFLYFIFFHNPFLFSQLKFQGHIFFENQRSNPLENARVSIWGNKYLRTSSSDINGNFEIELDSDFNPPFYLLSYKVGFYSRVFHLTGPSVFQDIGMKIVFISQDTSLSKTTYIYGRLVQSNSIPIPFVEVFGDYGERPVVSNDQGFFKLPLLSLDNRNETLLWLEKEGFNPLIYQVQNLTRYDENNPLIIILEPSPNSYNFDFTVHRSDNDQPIENVEIQIDDENVGNTNDQGKFQISKRLEPDRVSINSKFHHEFFSDTTLTLFLSSLWISKVVRLRPPSYKINTLVYYESSHKTLEGVPDVEFRLGNKLITQSNSLGQCDLTFKAIPGDKVSIKLPGNKGYSPPDTSIVLNKGQYSLNIHVTKQPVAINLIPIDSLSGERIAEIDSVGLIVNKHSIKAQKKGSKFTVITNIIEPGDELKINMKSQKYEILNESIKLIQIGRDEYEAAFYIRTKNLSTRQEYYVKEISSNEPREGILILDSEPGEARIYLDDIPGKSTPDTLKLFEGFHSIVLRKEGYVSVSMVVEIKADSVIKKNIELEGPIAPIQKISERLKVSIDLSVLFLVMKYPSGKIYPFPTFRVGGHFFPLLNPDCGLKLSYLASKVPSYYTSQEFGLGLFLGTNRFHWLIGFKESNFESFKKIDARFAGSSAESFFSINVGSEDKTKERLLFLNQYSNVIVFGFEKSLNAMNKSLPGQVEKEQELYIGFMRRWKRGILNFRFGVINPRLKVVDIEKNTQENNDPKSNEAGKQENNQNILNIKLARLLIGYSYFLN